jgi:hypothetical protein
MAARIFPAVGYLAAAWLAGTIAIVAPSVWEQWN